MKNKKGFTLVELLGVITILGILALIAMPTIDAIMTKNREKVYNTQIETIKNGLKTWGDGNALALPENNGEYLMINLGILKKAGFVDEDIKDPTTDACFSNDAVLTITKVGSGYSYYVDEESLKGGTNDDCEAPLDDYYLLLKGDNTIELDFYESYVEPGYSVIDSTGKILNVSVNITIKNKDGNVVSSIDNTSNVLNMYTITYEYSGIIVERKVIYGIVNEYVFEYKGSRQEVLLMPGKWKLEVWGAQGGQGGPSNMGGKGGYSSGIITLTSSTNIYVYVGGQGGGSTTTSASSGNRYGGFNGGGNSYQSGTPRAGGGGATDIRIGTDSLYARVIVAGGGGGNLYYSGNTYTAGAGGGTSGTGSPNNSGYSGSGGSQFTAGTGEMTGSFGKGAGPNGIGGTTICGGGGGWYGGGAGNAAGGGSGWVYTAANFNVWKNGNPTDAAGWLLNSSYYLTSASTIAGNQSFQDPDGTTVIGHSGNGYARITRVD